MTERVSVSDLFATMVCIARKELGMRQAQLAKAAGVSQQLISKLESANPPQISLDNALALVIALDLGTSDLRDLLTFARRRML